MSEKYAENRAFANYFQYRPFSIAVIFKNKISVGHDSAKWLPPILFGSSLLVAGGATMWLPDTFGVPLLETMEQAEKFYSNPHAARYDSENLDP